MLTLTNVGYRYPSAVAPALAGISGGVPAGSKLLITGQSGCGKTTLLRLLAGLLQRHGRGEVSGSLAVDGRDPSRCTPAERIRLLGLVGQEPADQLICGTVREELGFALASACWSLEAIAERVTEVADFVGLGDRLDDDPRALSGGQQARLVTGSALAARPPVLLLDEPLAQLDGVSSAALLALLDKVAASGTAVVMVEHRLAPTLPWASQVWLMQDGTRHWAGDSADVDEAALRAVGLAPTSLLRLQSSWDGGADSLRAALARPALAAGPSAASVLPSDPRLQTSGLTLRHGGRTILRGVDLSIGADEVVALVGANGSGKSTLLAALARHPQVERRGRLIAVPQDPDLSLYAETVADELAEGPTLAGRPAQPLVHDLAAQLRLTDHLEQSPHALSRGQRLRLAVGAALATEPDVLLLDEPTAGQDAHAVARLLTLLRRPGLTVVFATHDLGLAVEVADRVLIVADGEVRDAGGGAAALRLLAGHAPSRLPAHLHLCATRGWGALAPETVAARWPE